MADVALPQGYAVENAVALPQGYTAEPPQEPSVLANAITSLQNGVGNLFGAPHAIADLADRLRNEFGTKVMGRPADTEPGFVTRHTYSPSDINGALYSASGTVNNAVGLPAPRPYEPTTPEGRLGQNVLGSVVPSLVGGSGVGGLISRLAAGAGGTTAGTLYGQAVPDEPAGQLVASLLGGGAAAATAGAGMGLGNRVARPIWPNAYAAPKVANEIAGAAGVPGSAIA